MRELIYEWDRKRWLKRIGGLPSGDLANTLRIASLVEQQPKPVMQFKTSAWLTAYREIPAEKAKLPRP